MCNVSNSQHPIPKTTTKSLHLFIIYFLRSFFYAHISNVRIIFFSATKLYTVIRILLKSIKTTGIK